MGWQPAASAVDPALAERVGTQAGQFLLASVHAEIDEARPDPVQVLFDPHSPGQAVYAVTAVAGPLRNYLATAWGPGGHAANKQIVAHGTLEESRQAADEVVQGHLKAEGAARHYLLIGTFIGDSAV